MRGVGIIGRARSGKDAIAARLVKEHGYRRRALADPLKRMALDVDPVVGYEPGHFGALPVRLTAAVDRWGWDGVKSRYPEGRRFLQRLGTEGVRRQCGADFWVQRLLDDIENEPRAWAYEPPPVVVPDVRFENEARTLREAGFELWFVDRPGVVGDGHVSEKLGPDLARFVLHNDGAVTDLHRKVDSLMTKDN
ncbi:hypothetical protein ABT160_23600 [Streptomyces sp. NPDC001941]|uniref:deoxynucleotide monophosphate kinase family protein n=1 Tax=Streptomyces sp. NPDC001941 TaxID=3154659 RepID=UPI003331F295